MDAETIKRAERIFEELLERPTNERPALIAERCRDDATLRGLVVRLVESHDGGMGEFLEAPLIGTTLLDSALNPFTEGASPAQTDDVDPPKRIGGYEIVRLLGQGGMGVVYEARQEQPRRTVALEVIRPGLASRDVMRPFRREDDLLAQLQHPGIACIRDQGRYSEAESLYRHVADRLHATRPEDAARIAEADADLGEYIAQAGRFAETETVLLRACGAILAAGEDRDQACALERCSKALNELYDRWNRPEKTNAWRTRSTQQGTSPN